ncbi:pentapeptide repeat-containing protein [Bermanella sp. R86510]|uniref:pentapeptide repeat-containing protein n=1 Tax=unclassified Bermanella TaxID=2627862 RepID=UPI0037C6DC8C
MKPVISQDPMYQLLRNEQVAEFNKLRKQGKSCDLTGCDFKGVDLRALDVRGLDLTNAYFRGADLRSLDFRGAKLNGASLADAKISGCFFPDDISAQEVMMSVSQGTRLRQPSPDTAKRSQE